MSMSGYLVRGLEGSRYLFVIVQFLLGESCYFVYSSVKLKGPSQ